MEKLGTIGVICKLHSHSVLLLKQQRPIPWPPVSLSTIQMHVICLLRFNQEAATVTLERLRSSCRIIQLLRKTTVTRDIPPPPSLLFPSPVFYPKQNPSTTFSQEIPWKAFIVALPLHPNPLSRTPIPNPPKNTIHELCHAQTSTTVIIILSEFSQPLQHISIQQPSN